MVLQLQYIIRPLQIQVTKKTILKYFFKKKLRQIDIQKIHPVQTSALIQTIIFSKETNGMSGGVIAIVVIICLVAVAGGGVFLVVYFKRDSQIRKLLRLNSPPNTGTQSQPQSFDNLGYEAASSPSSLNETG